MVWPLRAALLRSARILVGNEADAEDLAQETLIKAFNAMDRFTPGTNLTAWLMTILRHARIDRLRARGAASADRSLDQIEYDPPGPSASDAPWTHPQDLLSGFSDQQIIDALQTLPEEIRWTLLLVDVEGWSHAEAAELLEVPSGTIKSRMHRGRGMLREALLPLARQLRRVPEKS